MAKRLTTTTYSLPKTPSPPPIIVPTEKKSSPKLRLVHNPKLKKQIILRISSSFSLSGSSSATPSRSPEKEVAASSKTPYPVVQRKQDIINRLTSSSKIIKNTPSPVTTPKKTIEKRLTSHSKITKTPSPVSRSSPNTPNNAASPKPAGREFKLFVFSEPEWKKPGLTREQRITAMKQRKYHLDRNYLPVPAKPKNFYPEQLKDFETVGMEHLEPPFAKFWGEF